MVFKHCQAIVLALVYCDDQNNVIRVRATNTNGTAARAIANAVTATIDEIKTQHQPTCKH